MELATISFSQLSWRSSNEILQMIPRSHPRVALRGHGGETSVLRMVVRVIGGVLIMLGLLPSQTSTTGTFNLDALRMHSANTVIATPPVFASSSSSSSCNPLTSKIVSERLLIDFEAVHAMSKDRLSQLKQFTAARHEKFVMARPGHEHYTLLEYLIHKFGPAETQPCAESKHRRHVMDIGTRYIASSLALGASHGIPVQTFDLPESLERKIAFRGKTQEQWQEAVLAAGIHITFQNQNLLTVSDEEFANYTATWFILLDTYHAPYSNPFEREFFARLASSGFQGILILDDIRLNNEMTKWWEELKENESSMGYGCFDLTSVGHGSGTGLVDFSGKVYVKRRTHARMIANQKAISAKPAAKMKPIKAELHRKDISELRKAF